MARIEDATVRAKASAGSLSFFEDRGLQRFGAVGRAASLSPVRRNMAAEI